MNQQDNIIYLAQSNSQKCYPKKIEEIDKSIPYFEIIKNQFNRYDIIPYSYESHDNAQRMSLWVNYIKDMILPNIDSKINLSGYYNIQLHDSPTYLNDNKDYKDVLCFAKLKNDKGAILIPDPYMIQNWGNMLNNIDDKKEWTDKKNKIIFAGTTTGNRDPLKNERINLCLWSLKNKDFCDFNITNIAQMNIENIKKYVPEFDNIYKLPINIDEQMQYKYQLNIDGNTCKFNVEHFKINSVIMKYKSNDMLWYYPLIQNNVHYTEVNKDIIKNTFEFFNNNPNLANVMIYNAKKLASELFRPIIHQIYTINLFESIGNNK